MTYSLIYSTIHHSEISIIRNLLEENHILCITPDEATHNASGIAGLGIGGMRVMVPQEQEERAFAVLKDRGFV